MPFRIFDEGTAHCLRKRKTRLSWAGKKEFFSGQTSSLILDSPLCQNSQFSPAAWLAWPVTGCSPFSFASRRFRRFALSKEESHKNLKTHVILHFDTPPVGLRALCSYRALQVAPRKIPRVLLSSDLLTDDSSRKTFSSYAHSYFGGKSCKNSRGVRQIIT